MVLLKSHERWSSKGNKHQASAGKCQGRFPGTSGAKPQPLSIHHTPEGKWLMRFSDETFCPKTNRCSSSYILSLMKTGWGKIVWTQFMQTNSVFLYQGTASQRIWFLLLTLLKHKKTSTGKILGDFTISQEFMFPNLRSEPKEHFCLGLCVWRFGQKPRVCLLFPG